MTMKRAPTKWALLSLLAHCQRGPQRGLGGMWVPARPEGYFSLFSRARLAWLVFSGRADALTWPEDDAP
jgi:hypothetical protein